MRILLLGPNPKYDSGMGKCGKEIAKQLDDEHDVHYFSPSLPANTGEAFEGFTLYGAPGHGDAARQHIQRILPKIDPDLFVTNKNWQSLQWLANQDSVLNQRYIEDGKPCPVVYYGPPVEAERKPPWFDRRLVDGHLNDVYFIPFTGARAEQYRGEWDIDGKMVPESADAPSWVPHGVDHDVFYPDESEHTRWREEMDLGDRFIVQYVGENWRRKNLDVLMEGFKTFKAEVRDRHDDANPVLSLHTAPRQSRGSDQFYSGWHLPRLADGVGLDYAPSTDRIDEDTDVFWTKQYPAHYIEKEVVATMIDAADVYALPTGGEAFSMTTLEAMACGTPVVQTQCETVKWLSGDAARYIYPAQTTRLNSGERHLIPSVLSLTKHLTALYENDEEWREMALDGRERAQDFSWDRTGREMTEAIEWIANDAERGQ